MTSDKMPPQLVGIILDEQAPLTLAPQLLDEVEALRARLRAMGGEAES